MTHTWSVQARRGLPQATLAGLKGRPHQLSVMFQAFPGSGRQMLAGRGLGAGSWEYLLAVWTPALSAVQPAGRPFAGILPLRPERRPRRRAPSAFTSHPRKVILQRVRWQRVKRQTAHGPYSHARGLPHVLVPSVSTVRLPHHSAEPVPSGEHPAGPHLALPSKPAGDPPQPPHTAGTQPGLCVHLHTPVTRARVCVHTPGPRTLREASGRWSLRRGPASEAPRPARG